MRCTDLHAIFALHLHAFHGLSGVPSREIPRFPLSWGSQGWGGVGRRKGEGRPPSGRAGVEGCGLCGDEGLSGSRLFSRPGPGRKEARCGASPRILVKFCFLLQRRL